MILGFFRPGKVIGHDFLETFNGRFRAKSLNQYGLLTLPDAAEK